MIIDEITNFVIKNYNYYAQHREKIKEFVKLHIIYGTLDCIIQNGKIIAVVRWNISPDGKTAHVLDLIIDKDYRGGLKIMKEFIRRNWVRFPNVEWIEFERQTKSNKKRRKYLIRKLLK